MRKTTLLKASLTCAALAIGVGLSAVAAHLEALGFITEDICTVIVFLLGVATSVALCFIWTKDMESTEIKRTIKVVWDKNQDLEEPNLPEYIQIPADLPDEDVYHYLTKNYGYTVISWDNLK